MAMAGMMTAGCGNAQLKQFSAALDLPSMSEYRYKIVQHEVCDEWEVRAWEEMRKAEAREKEAALKEENVTEHGIPIIDVTLDGCWAKRSQITNYAALSGAATIKLQSKYPMLYSILQNEASPELKQRIDRDRNKTTYQVDYCESGPGAQFEGLQRAADESGTGPCAQPMRLPGDPCRVGPKPRRAAPRTMSKQAGQGSTDPRAKCETTSATPPLGRSEYQDGVSKLGAIIMRDKIHRR